MANTGGSAFPCPEVLKPDGSLWNTGAEGMTLRDYFAGQALIGFLSRADTNRAGPSEDVAAFLAIGCYRAADAMLAERAK